jgi:multiple sugar transport system substrate-binding protein
MKFRFIAVVLMLTCACGTKKQENGKIIRFWSFGGTQLLMKYNREQVDRFNQTHPGIRIELSQKSWEQKRELIHANFSAGTGPDIVHVHASYAAEFGDIGYFYPINQFPDFEQVKKWYVPGLFESTKYKDNYYGLPCNGIAFILICNKELFDREGLRPPKTWSDFRNAAKKLTKDLDNDGQIDQYGFSMMGADRGGFEYRIAPFILKAGGSILSPDLKKPTFNDAIGVATVRLFTDMYQIDHSVTPGFLGYSLTDINDMLASNKVAMSVEGPWYPSILHERKPGKELVVVPIPVPDDRLAQYEQAPTLQDMCMLTINKATPYPDESWEFIKFMRTPEADMNWVTQDFGALPVTTAAFASPQAEQQPNHAMYRREFTNAVPWPPHPQMMAIISDIMAPYTEKAIVGEMTISAALDKAAEETSAIINQ